MAAERAARIRVRIKDSQMYVGNANGVPTLGKQAGAFVFGGAGGGLAYDAAAGYGRRTVGWPSRLFGPNAALQWSLDTLRNRSLDADRKNPYAGALTDKLTANIVGTGIKPQSLCKNVELRKQIMRLWEDWVDESDADGMFDFYGQQMMAVRGYITGGETFARFRFRRMSDGMKVPLQIQLLEADYVPTVWNQFYYDNQIVMGIEANRIGKRVAYWMYPQHPGDLLVKPAVNMQPGRVPSSEVAHIYLPRRIGQLRGEPHLVRALVKLHDIDSYDDAEVMRMKTTALLAGFIKKTGDSGPLIDEAEEVGGDDNVVTWEPGTMQVLNQGEDVTFSQPPQVGNNYEAWMRQQARLIATASMMLYEELTGDYSQLNDRTLRAALNGIRRQYSMLQHHMVVFQFCRPVWQRFINSAIISGALTVPTDADMADVMRVRWVPEKWPYIHPVQDIQAERDEVAAGFASRTDQVIERGEDPEEVDATNAADNARADKLGLAYTSDGRNATKKGAAPDGKPTEDEAQPGGK